MNHSDNGISEKPRSQEDSDKGHFYQNGFLNGSDNWLGTRFPIQGDFGFLNHSKIRSTKNHPSLPHPEIQAFLKRAIIRWFTYSAFENQTDPNYSEQLNAVENCVGPRWLPKFSPKRDAWKTLAGFILLPRGWQLKRKLWSTVWDNMMTYLQTIFWTSAFVGLNWMEIRGGWVGVSTELATVMSICQTSGSQVNRNGNHEWVMVDGWWLAA